MPSRFTEIVRVAALVGRTAPSLTLVAALSAIGLAAMAPAIAYTSMRMFDAVLVTHSESETILWMSIEVGLAAMVTVFTCLQQDTGRLLREPLALEMTTALVDKLATIPLTDLEDPDVRTQVAEARETAELRSGQLVVDMLAVLQGVVSLTICLIIVAQFTWLAVLVVAAAIPCTIAELWSARVMYRAGASLAHDRQRFDRLEDTLTSSACRVENKFLDADRRLAARLRMIGRRLGAAQVRVWHRAGAAVAIAQLLPTLGHYGINLYLGIETVRGQMTFGALTLCLISLYNTQQFSQTALFAARSAGEALLHVRSTFALLDRPVPTRCEGPQSMAGHPGLRLEDAGFRYPGADSWAVRHVNLAIAPGEMVGIVGGNGSGKTTLVRLLTGLYRPSEGRVTLDGRELVNWDEAALRARFAVVFQDFARYRMSLRDNLALPPGDGDEPPAEACAASGVDRLLAELPRGADTALTTSFDGGVELSGGQWQKVALARAFARRDADLLIMDEPTSALDAPSERRVLDHLHSRRRVRTVVLITHRLAALQWADKIVLLEKGRASLVRA